MNIKEIHKFLLQEGFKVKIVIKGGLEHIEIPSEETKYYLHLIGLTIQLFDEDMTIMHARQYKTDFSFYFNLARILASLYEIDCRISGTQYKYIWEGL